MLKLKTIVMYAALAGQASSFQLWKGADTSETNNERRLQLNLGIVPFLFNLVSGLGINLFNNLLSDVVGVYDPFILDQGFTKNLGVFPTDLCAETTITANVTVNATEGFSTLEIGELSMSTFAVDAPEFDLGFTASASIDSLLADIYGDLTGVCGEETDTKELLGDIGLTGAKFEFEFAAAMMLNMSGFAMYYVNISTFNVNWTSFGLNVSGLGDFQESADELDSYIEEVFTEAFSSKVNATLLQDMIDEFVPFSIP